MKDTTHQQLHPGFIFKGRKYKTVAGLLNAIIADSGASSVGMVSSKHTVTAYGPGRSDVLAVYDVSPPKAGEAQVFTRQERKST